MKISQTKIVDQNSWDGRKRSSSPRIAAKIQPYPQLKLMQSNDSKFSLLTFGLLHP